MADLCTLANLKSDLGITSTSEDTELSRKITAVSDDFLGEIRRDDFTPAIEYTDRVRGNGTCEIFLKHWPVNSITGVTINGDAVDEWDPDDDTSTGWWFIDDAAPEDRQKLVLVGKVFSCSSIPNVVIVYNAGYDDIPPAVSQAVIEWIAFRRGLAQIQTTNQASSSVQMGDYSEGGIAAESGRFQALDKPQSVQSVIDQYRRAMI